MRTASRTVLVAGFAALAAALPACVHPDRSTTFAPDFERARTAAEEPRTEVPDALRPGVEPSPAWPAPREDGTLPLSIEQAALVALQRNRDLRVRRLGPVIEGAFAQLERGAFDPELFASFSYLEERENEVSRSTSDQFSAAGDERELRAGVRQDLPSGTSLEASVEQTRESSNRAPEQERSRIGLTVTQSLLRGLGSTVNLVDVRQAELGAVASRHELRAFTQAVLADVLVAYWNVVLAQQEIRVVDESLSVAQLQLGDVQERIDVGVLPDAEQASARVEVARREQQLIDARSLLEERRLRLLRLLGVTDDDALAIDATSPLELDPAPLPDGDDRIAVARSSRPDIAEAKLRLAQDELETIVTRDGLLPRLEFFVTVGRSGFADTFPDSFRQLDERTYDWEVGLRLTHVLGDRAAEARDRIARAERRTARLAIENLEELAAFQVRLALNELERARQQIAASRTTRELEARALAAEQERFNAGASTGLLVAQAQRDLLASRIAEVRSQVAYRIALVRLHFAEGTLLERSGVRIATDELE